jgi:hypothetical protein
MRLMVGLLARLFFFVCFAFVEIDALVTLAHRSDWNLFFWALIGFPITVLVWPWTHWAFGVPLWIIGVTMLVSYPVSTIVGRLDPVDF